MAVSDYSTTPASNTTVGGINIAENCPPGNMNNAVRQIMADIRVMFNGLPVVTGFMPINGGTFTGTQPKYTGEGAFLHHADSAMLSGKVHVLPEGAANPTGLASGDLIFYIAP